MFKICKNTLTFFMKSKCVFILHLLYKYKNILKQINLEQFFQHIFRSLRVLDCHVPVNHAVEI